MNRKLFSKLRTILARLRFNGSSKYWERRYRQGGNSGAGSYGRLARFKSEFLNDFVAQHSIASVVEFGCGDGAQLALSNYPNYTGIDVSQTAIDLCKNTFGNDSSKRFLMLAAVPVSLSADLSLSLDVIYHLIEDDVFNDYMGRLFGSAHRYVAIYSSNCNKSWPAAHVRHRVFTKWVTEKQPEWELIVHHPNPYPYDAQNGTETSFSDFYIFSRRVASQRHCGL